MAQAMAARLDRCLGNFPLPPFNATRPSSSRLLRAIAITTRLIPFSSAFPFPPPSLPRPFPKPAATPPSIIFPPFFELNPGEPFTATPFSRSRRVCLQWRCATPIIPGVLHLRTGAASRYNADDDDYERRRMDR